MSARIEFLPTPIPGHVNPTLAVAAELAAAGEQVVYRLPESFRGAVEATGASLEPIRFPPALSGGPGAGGGGEDPLTTLMLTPLRMTRACLSVLPQILDALEDDPPDLVVYDALSVWGRLAASRLHCPAAMSWASYAMNAAFSYALAPSADGPASAQLQRAVEAFAADMHVLSGTYDTPRLNLHDLFLHAEPLSLVFVARVWQPHAESFDGRYRFVGPAPRASSCAPLDAELAGFLDAGPPVVFASLGTMFHRWPAFYALSAEALSDAPLRLLIAGAEPAAPGDRGGVLRRRHVEQPAVLDRARVFVTHGGMSSVTEALARGVPMVLIPQMPEQRLTAERVAAAGAGRVLERDGLTAGALREAVLAVAEDPGYAARAGRLWTTLEDSGAAAMPGAGRGAGARAAAALRPYARVPVGSW
ncbi:MAG: macrolide family glycosyltransferase [Solirubrobacteraceae bacterium]